MNYVKGASHAFTGPTTTTTTAFWIGGLRVDACTLATKLLEHECPLLSLVQQLPGWGLPHPRGSRGRSRGIRTFGLVNIHNA